MKRKQNLIRLTILTTVFALSAGLVIATRASKPTRVVAAQNLTNYGTYTYNGSYYDEIDFTASDGMDGNLRKALTSKIYPAGFYTYSGSGANYLSTVLQSADEDPTNSNNMVYLYTRNSVTKNAASSWNREHVWCQSLSNDNWGTTKGGTDILHIRPVYDSVNSSRGNKPYADLGHSGAKYYNDMLYGYADKTYFEPIDAVKGDVARTIMYLWTTYNNTTKPLNILNVFKDYNTLISWHTQDKPDVLEGNRNNYAQTSRQGNRNPFVDHPELAWRIFGSQVSASVKNACMEAYPSNSGSEAIDPTGISLNKSTSTLKEGNKLQLSATLEPSGATGTVSWSTNNNSVASVNNNGLVTANGQGEATITASVSGYSASCVITVIPSNINYGSFTQPLSITDAKELLDLTGSNLSAEPFYVKGIVSSNSAYSSHSDYDYVWLESEDGSDNQAFELYRAELHLTDDDTDYSAANSMVGKEVIAYGYGKIFNGTYELCTSSSEPKKPQILSLKYPIATAISLDNYEIEVEAGENVTLTATLSPVNNSSSVTWQSSDTSVAAVNNGVVTGVAPGRAIITAKVSNNPDVDAECEVTVVTPSDQFATLSVASSIEIGDTVYLTCNYALAQYDGPSGNSQDSFGTYTTFETKPDDTIGALEVCAGNQEDTYALKIKTGDHANKYLAWSGSKNSLKVATTSDDHSSWTIAFDENNNATITNVYDTQRVLWWNNDYPRFACYKGHVADNTYKNVQLWKLTVTQSDEPRDYLNNISLTATIHASESTVTDETTSAATFSEVMSDNDIPNNFMIGDVSFTGAKGTHANTSPMYYENGESLRIYVDNTLTFTAPGTITKISFTFSEGSNETSITSNDATYSTELGYWECSSKTVVFSVAEKKRISDVSITYEKEELVVTGATMRFGAIIPVETWETIASKWEISDYGVMLFKEIHNKEYYSETPVQDIYTANGDLSVISRGSGTPPTAVDGNYAFEVQIGVNNTTKYGLVVCAAPFLVIDDIVYFLGEMQYSINSLANYYLNHDGATLSEAALNILAGN